MIPATTLPMEITEAPIIPIMKLYLEKLELLTNEERQVFMKIFECLNTPMKLRYESQSTEKVLCGYCKSKGTAY